MGFNKLLASHAGAPVLHRTLGEFQACDDIAEIVLVAGEEVRAAVEQWQTEGHLTKLRAIVPGGTERHFSVWAGLQAISAEATLVAVHDGARPLIRPEQISRCIAQASATGAATCARPMSETLKRADATGSITETIDRDGVWVMETPQVFNRALLVKAYEAVLAAGALVTDEVSAVQHLDEPVFVVNNFMRDWGHQFVYDAPVLRRCLEEAGFTGVTQPALMESPEPSLRGLEHAARMPEGFLAFESLVFEAVKEGSGS